MKRSLLYLVIVVSILSSSIQKTYAGILFSDTFNTDTTANYIKKELQNPYSPPMVLSYAATEHAIRFSGNEGSFWYYNQLSGVYNGTVSATVKFEKFGTLDGNGNGLGAAVGLRVDPDGSFAHWGVWGGLYTYFGTQCAIIGDGCFDYIGTSYPYSEGQTYDLRLELTGSHATLYINGSKVFERDGITQPLSGLGATAVNVSDGASWSEPSSFLIDNWQVTSGTTPPATVTIRGTVYDAESDTTIPNVNVSANGENTQTGLDGKYELNLLDSGQISITASRQGYQSQNKVVSVDYGMPLTIDFRLLPFNVSRIVDSGFRPDTNGFGFNNWAPLDFSWVKPDIKIGGFCKGMTFAALDYFLLGIQPLQDSSPNWNDPQVIFIEWKQLSSSIMEMEWGELRQYNPYEGSWVEENYNIIRDNLAKGIPCPISLLSDPWQGFKMGHTILAYKVVEKSREGNNLREILLYDNNYHDQTTVITLIYENGEWKLSSAYDDKYTRFIAVPAKLDINGLPLGWVFHSPGTLLITAPDGSVINHNISEINGGYYRTLDINGDGHDEQIAFVLAPKEGRYSVTVIPDTNAEPNATYSLEEQKFGETTVLAQDVPISEVPTEPYKSIVVLPALTCEQALALMDYNLVDKNRIGRTEFEYTFRLRVANSWIHDINDVTIRLIQEPNNTTVLNDTVHFATIQAGKEAYSDDTFKIRTDRTVEGLKSDVVWKVCDCKMERKTDFNRDWVVNFIDFATFAQEWLSTGTNIPQDVYPDEKVDIMDLYVFVDEWLK
jgi:hypothetical protein